jgi:membrane dipeptidase
MSGTAQANDVNTEDATLVFDPYANMSEEHIAFVHSLPIWDMVWQIDPPMRNSWDSLERYRKSGVRHLSVTLAGDDHSPEAALRWIADARAAVRSRAETMILADRVAQIDQAHAENKLAITFHFEGTECFARELSLVDAFRRLGVRHNLIAFNKQNSAGGGCAEENDAGLTRYGKLLVKRMEQAGMLIDLSHVGYRTSMDVIGMAECPVMFTHSNPHALYPHFRNILDDQIDGCAQTGGVVGVSGSTMYMDAKKPTIDAIFAQIDYLVSRIGPNHVGFGFDTVFDGKAVVAFVRARPDEWPGSNDKPLRYSDPEQIPALIVRMLAAGYGEDAVRAIACNNFRRLYAAAEAVSEANT